MIRIAAVGDVHVGLDSVGVLRPHFETLNERADVFVLAGDLTRHGDVREAEVLAAELEGLTIPVVTVLGNHDYHQDHNEEIKHVMEDAGASVLECSTTTVEVDGSRVSFAGCKGFGGGFSGASGTDFGEPEMKAFIRHTKSVADGLEAALRKADGDARVAVLHYSPVPDTLAGERLEIYPFLGSYFLAEAIDRAGCDLVVHGHAHGGTEKGVTPGGIHVRNVAQPVIRRAFSLYCLGGNEEHPEC